MTFTFTATAVAPCGWAATWWSSVEPPLALLLPIKELSLILASSTTTAVVAFSGAYTTGTATGYAFTPIAGVFVGCSYQSTAIKHNIWSRYWPGTSDSNGDITAYVVTDPNAQFSVQNRQQQHDIDCS